MMRLKYKIHIIAQEFFQFSLITYFVLFFIETVKEGFVSFFFNLNIILGVVFVSGIVFILTYEKKEEPLVIKEKTKRAELQKSICVSLGCAIFVYYQLRLFGDIAFFGGAFTLVIMFIFSYIIFMDYHRSATRSRTQVVAPASLEKVAVQPSIAFGFNIQRNTNVPLLHVHKIRAEATRVLTLVQEKSSGIAVRYKNANLEHIYLSKILPHDTVLQETLQKLAQNLPTDSEYNELTEAIVSENFHPQERSHLEQKKQATERGALESLVVVYANNLDMRVKQLEILL